MSHLVYFIEKHKCERLNELGAISLRSSYGVIYGEDLGAVLGAMLGEIDWYRCGCFFSGQHP